jgi:1-deoxy-D-xylulose-5-phosphate reductoisomerase
LKRLSILGSTGSIGVSTLDIVSRFPERFEVVALAAGGNINLLKEQVETFRPRYVSVAEEEGAISLKGIGCEVLHGVEGAMAVATVPEADMVVSAIVGAAGLVPTVSAIKAGKDIALANKETLVMAGELVMKEAREAGVSILPVDSEHSAIFQSIAGHNRAEIKRLILTASGGPFLNYPLEDLKRVAPNDALNHPTWQMGRKITIDSATLMNKGLEVIEARWLFDIPPGRIDVHIHPQSIIHSMVEYIDGSVIAQMGIPDMRIPISYALSYPERLPIPLPSLNLFDIERLTFMRPDHDRFPSLKLAYRALDEGGTMPAVLNAANEVAVDVFLNGRIGFLDIPRLIEGVMSSHSKETVSHVDDVLRADLWARGKAKEMIRGLA